MADPIERMVALAECLERAKTDPRFTEYLDATDREVNAALAVMGFRNVQEVRKSLRLAVARIVAARKIAHEQIIELAREEGITLGMD